MTTAASTLPLPRVRSKTFASWLAFAGGSLGLHRFYLFGLRDRWAWAHPWPTLLGLYGVHRLDVLGQDDPLSWVLIPLLGLMISASMLVAIVYGLTSDEQWNARFNAGLAPRRSGWLAVICVVLSLMVGAGVLMATLAYGTQHYFESQIEAAREISQPPTRRTAPGWPSRPPRPPPPRPGS